MEPSTNRNQSLLFGTTGCVLIITRGVIDGCSGLPPSSWPLRYSVAYSRRRQFSSCPSLCLELMEPGCICGTSRGSLRQASKATPALNSPLHPSSLDPCSMSLHLPIWNAYTLSFITAVSVAIKFYLEQYGDSSLLFPALTSAISLKGDTEIQI